MIEDLITEREYVLLTRRKNWKTAVDEYKSEQDLEDKFMSDEEFESIGDFILHNERLSEFLHDFAVHGDTHLGTVKKKIESGYFTSLNLLVNRELMSNNGRRSLSVKAKAFLFEYGRRKYLSD